MRSACALACLTMLLACGKVVEPEPRDHEPAADEPSSQPAASSPADAPVTCAPVDRGDECAFDYDCPLDSVCVDSGKHAPGYQELCSDGSYRNVTEDDRPVLACVPGTRTDENGCVERNFHEECTTDDECPAGEACVDSGRTMPSSTTVCPNGSSSGSTDLRVIHECRASRDGGS